MMMHRLFTGSMELMRGMMSFLRVSARVTESAAPVYIDMPDHGVSHDKRVRVIPTASSSSRRGTVSGPVSAGGLAGVGVTEAGEPPGGGEVSAVTYGLSYLCCRSRHSRL